MSYSKLASGKVPAHSSNYTQGRRGYKICKFTPHHMSGVLTAEQCGKIFQSSSRNASSNYGIGNDGKIMCYVDEENRAWTSSSSWNDCQAITVEVSNCERGGKWRVSDKAWNSLVNLAVDVCRRYNFRLSFTGNKNGSLTMHKMYANTDCPGAYLESKMNELAKTVNAILDGKQPQPQPVEYKNGDVVEISTPMLFTGAIRDGLYLYDTKVEQIWVGNEVKSLIKNDNLMARVTFVCYAENDSALVEIYSGEPFVQQFKVKKECVKKKL